MQYFGAGGWAKRTWLHQSTKIKKNRMQYSLTFLHQSTKLNISVIGISCHFDKGESPPHGEAMGERSSYFLQQDAPCNISAYHTYEVALSL